MSKAIVVAQTGGPEVLQYQDVPVNKPRKGEVQVRVEAVGHQVSRLSRVRYGPLELPADLAAGKWRELSTLKRYLDISLEMLREAGQSYFSGANSVIAPTADVTQTIIWDNVQVGDGAKVDRCVLADNVTVRSGERIENSIVVRRDLVEGKKRPDKALPGDFRGENFVVPL